ncbi:MAG: hypothetical protein R3B45_14280 [Bdellovibrionota bacterium]
MSFFLVLNAFLAASCTFIKDVVGYDSGVPLNTFVAKNGRYFPSFVEKFFLSTKTYYRDYPSLAEARADLKMIEVKPLTDGKAPFNEANLSWSADGAYLGYEVITPRERRILLKNLVGNYSRDLYIVPKQSHHFLEGMVSRSIFSYNAGLRWSRDSTRYAFMSNGGTGEYNIYVGAVGSQEKIVAKSNTKDGYATWSPKTNEIAFVSSRSGGGDIYSIRLNNNEIVRLSDSPSVDIFPEWFADGKKIVYSSGNSLNHDLMILSRKDNKWKKPYRFTDWKMDDLRPTISPNGKLISFYAGGVESNGSGGSKWHIYVVPYVEGKTYHRDELSLMKIADNVVVDLNTGPAWSPDSRKIFYVANEPQKFNPIYGYDLYTGRRFLLDTKTKMNRDILMSSMGIISFRAQVGAWDRVFVALTNQGLQLQNGEKTEVDVMGKIHYIHR